MSSKPLSKLPGLIVLASALSIGFVAAGPAAAEDAPIQLAAASTPISAGAKQAMAFPAHEAGVRAAAARGPDELRWYVQRTRMIHQFYYNDFAKDLPSAG